MPEHIEREKALKLIESAETWGWSNSNAKQKPSGV